MNKLIFCSGNEEKFSNAQMVCEQYGIELEQAKLEIDEIQSEDGDKIITDKLNKAYEIMKKPVIVSDDTWEIPALKGFPGPYMKSINHWFTTEDYLRLTSDLEDRTILLIERLAYKDESETKIFKHIVRGSLLKEAKGNYGNANHKLVSLDGDNGLSIAEIYDKKLNNVAREAAGIWHDLINWYKSHSSI